MATGLRCAHAHHTTTHYHIFSEIFHLFFLILTPCPSNERGEVRAFELVKRFAFCRAERVEA
jgi:hypothetical protein